MNNSEKIKWVVNEETRFFTSPAASVEDFCKDETDAARRFHSTIPGYRATPLRGQNALAAMLGVKAVYIKDESYRFGLNAFKVLGASYAIARYLGTRLGEDARNVTYDLITSEETRSRLGGTTFATTTDGNHGRAVAWTARMLRQGAVVYMPKGSTKRRADAIASEGASVTIRDCNYDESVRLTAEEAAEKGWVVVQDTAWEGYEDIPRFIMQGYGTMAGEAAEQLAEYGVERPSHVFVQAGVGSLAGAVQGFFKSRYPENSPRVVVAEASKADCFYRSMLAGDGVPHAVGGELDTLMAGLACGEANTIAFDILRDYASAFVSCPDYVAAHGMRVLGNPLNGDEKVVSGESGAVTAGLLSFLMRDKSLNELRSALDLNEDSVVLLFSTEGDTDPERYRSIVWDGEYPTCGMREENQANI